MPRKAHNAKLDSRTARSKLPAQHEPYWTKCGPALSLGYRKGTRGSSWQVRAYDGAKYHKTAMGIPDDNVEADDVEADDVKIRTFHQAIAAALAWWKHEQDKLSGAIPKAGPVTVRAAADAYLEYYKHKGGKDLKSVESRLKLHILPTFGETEISKLTKAQIEKWHHGLASTARLSRSPKLGPRKLRSLDLSDLDAVRRRRSAANRTLTVLKALLNHAFAAHESITSDKAWRTVRPYPAVDAARERFLSEAEASKLISSTSGTFHDIALAALLTGCRYGELSAATVGNVDLAAGTLYVATSKSGHPRHVFLTEAATELFRRLMKNRKVRDRVFMRTKDAEWKTSDQLRPMKLACKAASIDPPVGFHILRHSHASHLVANGVQLQVVAAQIGHRSTVMTERHYAHLQPSFVAEQIRSKLPAFGVSAASFPK